MSHLPVRKEKVCLNCGAQTPQRFCSNCGQENIEPKETVWHFITHFIKDVSHFDGKFFSTLKFLLFKPGFLTKEYVAGKRVRYLDPVRMYLFTSFIFFLIFFSVFKIDEARINGSISFGDNSNEKIISSAINDSSSLKYINDAIARKKNKDSIDNSRFTEEEYSSREEYDSLIRIGKINPSWLDRKLNYKQIDLNKKYKKDQSTLIENFLESMLHNFPKMLFISLPFAALILQILYIRKKENYYVGHGIFIIHLYIFIFLMMLLGIGISQFISVFNLNIFNFYTPAIALLILYYLYKAMRTYYGQSRKTTIAKWILFNFLFFLLILLLSISLVFLSFILL